MNKQFGNDGYEDSFYNNDEVKCKLYIGNVDRWFNYSL